MTNVEVKGPNILDSPIFYLNVFPNVDAFAHLSPSVDTPNLIGN